MLVRGKPMESHSLARFTILSSSSRPVFSSVSIVVVTFSADRSLRPVSRLRVSALFFPDIYANSYSRGCNLKKWSLDGKLFHLLDITRGTILWIYFLALNVTRILCIFARLWIGNIGRLWTVIGDWELEKYEGLNSNVVFFLEFFDPSDV